MFRLSHVFTIGHCITNLMWDVHTKKNLSVNTLICYSNRGINLHICNARTVEILDYHQWFEIQRFPRNQQFSLVAFGSIKNLWWIYNIYKPLYRHCMNYINIVLINTFVYWYKHTGRYIRPNKELFSITKAYK